jgi:hypothetical protein
MTASGLDRIAHIVVAGVDVHPGEDHRVVTQQPRAGGSWGAAGCEQSSRGVPRVVEADSGQPGGLRQPPELVVVGLTA